MATTTTRRRGPGFYETEDGYEVRRDGAEWVVLSQGQVVDRLPTKTRALRFINHAREELARSLREKREIDLTDHRPETSHRETELPPVLSVCRASVVYHVTDQGRRVATFNMWVDAVRYVMEQDPGFEIHVDETWFIATEAQGVATELWG